MVKIRPTLLPDNAARMPDPPYADVVISAPRRRVGRKGIYEDAGESAHSPETPFSGLLPRD
jgi:hypothetical protein